MTRERVIQDINNNLVNLVKNERPLDERNSK